MSKALPKGGSALSYVQGYEHPASRREFPYLASGRFLMTIGKMAFGVFLGNLMSFALAFLVMSFMGQMDDNQAASDALKRQHDEILRDALDSPKPGH